MSEQSAREKLCAPVRTVSEEKYRSLFENSRDALITAETPSGRFTSGNPAALKMFGAKSLEEFVSHGPRDLSPERQPDGRDSAEKAREMIETALREGSHFFEWTHRRISGEEFPADVLLTRMELDGKVILLATVRDITERKRTEERLRLQSAALEAAANGIFITDSQGIILWVNPAFTSLTGWSPGETIGKTPRILKSDKQETTFYRGLWETITAGCVWRGEMINRRKDGNLYTIEMTITPVRNEHGEITNFVAINQDVTARKRVEQAVLHLAAIVESSGDAIVSTDLQGIITSWNAAAERLYGYTGDEIIGQSVEQIIPQERHQEKTDVLQQVSTGGRVSNFESCCVAKDGHRIPVSLTVSPLKDAWGNVIGTSAVIRDITERQQAEEALRASEANLAEAQRVAKMGSWSFDLATNAVSWSEELHRIFGIDMTDFGGTYESFVSRVHPDDRDRVLRTNAAARAQGKAYNLEYRIVLPSGELKTICEVGYAATDSTGKTTRLFGIAQDITDRKKVEEALCKSERNYRGLFESSRDALMTTDPLTMRFTSGNPAALRMFGVKNEEEFVSYGPRDLSPERQPDGRDSAEKAGEMIETALREGSHFFEWTHRRIDGEVFPADVLLTRMERDGKVILQATVRDITDRKKVEEALRASEERHRSLFETMQEGFALCEIICNGDGKPCDFRYLEVNPAFEGILGIKRTEAINKTARELFPQIESYWIDTYGTVALTGVATHFENYLQALDKHFAVTAFSPKRGQFAAVFMDVTERKRTDETLQETNRRLEDALDNLSTAQEQVIRQERLTALGTMASGIAHDFNNSLTAILGGSELLLQRPDYLGDREKTRSYIEMMNTAAQDAGKVVNRLREFYRHREEYEVPVSLNVNDLVGEAVTLTEAKWKVETEARSAPVKVCTDLQEVPPVTGNAAELREALTNLIFNAVDAMPGGGTITIRTRRDHDRVVLEIGDTGTGMTEEVRRRCLEPFFTTKGERGTGLGLSMVYGVLQRHQGTVDIETEVGKGTTFIIRLPVPTAQPRSEPKAQPVNAVQHLRMLVVDDEAVVRRIVGEYLKLDGHIVEAVDSGCGGLEKFRNGRFDLVLVDRAMPDMSGDQVATAMKSVNPSVPIIMLTGFGSMMEAADEKPVGVDLVLGKPVTINALRAAISRAVASVN